MTQTIKHAKVRVNLFNSKRARKGKKVFNRCYPQFSGMGVCIGRSELGR